VGLIKTSYSRLNNRFKPHIEVLEKENKIIKSIENIFEIKI
jgi:hypothetical protein